MEMSQKKFEIVCVGEFRSKVTSSLSFMVQLLMHDFDPRKKNIVAEVGLVGSGLVTINSGPE